MLNVKARQKYLKQLGFYKGEVDGKEGDATKCAYLALQKKYMPIRYQDGKYGAATNTVLLNAARVKLRCPNFDLTEFRCGCGGRYCSGYPALLNIQLLKNLQTLRRYYKQPIGIASGLRCQTYNDSLTGSIKTSKHTKGKALDIYGKMTGTPTKRRKVIKKWYTLPSATYAYSDTPNMGTSVHIDVK